MSCSTFLSCYLIADDEAVCDHILPVCPVRAVPWDLTLLTEIQVHVRDWLRDDYLFEFSGSEGPSKDSEVDDPTGMHSILKVMATGIFQA